MASHDHSPTLDPPEKLRLGDGARVVGLAALAIGVVALLAAFAIAYALGENAVPQTYLAYLTNFGFFLSISLGALFFVAIQHLVRAGWSVTVRRIAEILAANVVVLFILVLPIIIGLREIYIWMTPDDESVSKFVRYTIEHKSAWLSDGFFVLRLGIYFVIWTLLARYFYQRSTEQDQTGDPDLTLKMQAAAPLAVVLFALTICLAAFDLFMSLDPAWFSTIFGVYYFSGAMMGFFAVAILASMGLQSRGLVPTAINTEHYHDLGKFMYGFVIFWMYIAYSQYMLIWYASIPEELPWLVNRGLSTAEAAGGDPVAMVLQNANGWSVLALIILIGHFFIPFLGLMSRHVKRNRYALGFWAIWLLIMHYLDMVWIVMPTLTDNRGEYLGVGTMGLVALALTFVGIGGIYLAGAIKFAAGNAVVPTKDPRLKESLGFHQPI